jgi:FkbM family methyltransferase
MYYLKCILAKTPSEFQEELKRIHYRWQIKKGSFKSDEPEYDYLSEYIKEGDWVLDIGANVGHYTKRFSELVRSSGRVIAFEPVPSTFTQLANNSKYFAYKNVTLINAAISDKTEEVWMEIPKYDSGITNYYQANIADSKSELSVLSLPYDVLNIKQSISFIKIDAEGHEPYVFKGLINAIENFRPVLLVETVNQEMRDKLYKLGYKEKRYGGSPNVLFTVK